MQDLFGSLGPDSSLSTVLADLASRLQGLATTPEDVALQTEVGNQANLLAQRIRTTAVDIQSLRLQADLEIQTAVTEVVSVRSGRGMGAVKRISYVEARPHKVLSFCW